MRAFIKKKNGIIGIPENAILLKDISDDGYFIYSIKYKVNPFLAAQNSAYKVKISATLKPNDKQETKFFTTTEPQELVKNILTKSSADKDLVRSYEENIITSIVSDITKRIPNDSARNLNSTNNSPLKIKKEIKLQSLAELNKQNQSVPILQKNIVVNNTLTETKVNSVDIKNVSINLILKKGIDPANIGSKLNNTIVSSFKTYSGLLQIPQNYNNALPEEKLLIDSGTNNSITTISTQSYLDNNSFIPVIVNNPQNMIEIEETLKIPIGSIEEKDFFIIFDLLSTKDLTVENLTTSVAHSKNINIFVTVLKPPTVKSITTNKLGKTVLLIKQEDLQAYGVHIVKKTMNKNIPLIDAQYTYVANINLKVDDGLVRFEDSNSNFNPTIYRIIPWNYSKMFSSEFTSVITKSNDNSIFLDIKKEKAINFATLSYNIEENGMEIEIKNIPPEPISLKLLRLDLTLFEKTPTLIGQQIQLTGRGSSSISVIDSTVKNGHVYKYICEFLTKTGKIEYASNQLIVEYITVNNNIVNTTVSTPTVNQNGQNIDVTFTIQSNLIERSIDLIKKAMENQGLFNIFQEDILQNKEKLQNLIGYKITRENLTTGEFEEFGVIVDKTFSDLNFGKIRNVKPVQNGFDYRYHIITYLRSPETLLDTFTREIQTSINNSYEFSPYKWYHPITLSNGTLVSVNSLKRNYSKNDFTFGSIGNIVTTNISLTEPLPSIYDAKASIVATNLVSIQWKVQGKINKIDHFLIVAEILGMKKIIGKCHNISDGNYFQYIDVIEKNEHGAYVYNIMPVLYDYSRGTSISTNQIII